MRIQEDIYTAMLRSGRSNSSIIMDQKNLILVDCGVGPRILEQKLGEVDRAIDQITGALITHSHFDHMNEATLRKLTSHGISIYCNSGVKEIALGKAKAAHRKLIKKYLCVINSQAAFQVGDFKIKAFDLKHDSDGGCHGYILKRKTEKGSEKIVYATDFAYPSQRIKKIFRDSHIIFIESDHCDVMLDRCPDIPDFVKDNHIRQYHISNAQCCDLLKDSLTNSNILPRKIHLLHISDNINTEKKALSMCKQMLKKNGLKGAVVYV